MKRIYAARWAPVAWLDALLKRLAMLIASVLVTYGVLLLIVVVMGGEDDPRKKTLKSIIYVVIALALWILWNTVRLIVDPIRAALSGNFLGDKNAAVAKAAADASSPLLARVSASNAQTPPDIGEHMKREFVLVQGEAVQVSYMKKWVGKGDPSSPQCRYGGVDPTVSGVPAKKLANDVFEFMQAHMRPPFGSAPAGTDEAFLASWLRRIESGERAGTLAGDDEKARRSLNRWSKGWHLGLNL